VELRTQQSLSDFWDYKSHYASLHDRSLNINPRLFFFFAISSESLDPQPSFSYVETMCGFQNTRRG
jgi:hypothetical protein